MDRFGAHAITTDKEEDIAIQDIPVQSLRDQRAQTIKAFPRMFN